MDITHLDDSDPVVESYLKDQFPYAEKLVEHAELRKDVSVRLSYTVRPWAERPRQGCLASGQPGIIWDIGFYPRFRRFDVARLWRHLNPYTRQLLLHLLVPDVRHVEVTFAAVDDGALVAAAMGDVLQSVLHCAIPLTDNEINSWIDDAPRTPPSFDSRVQVSTAWSFVDDSTTPISLFGAL